MALRRITVAEELSNINSCQYLPAVRESAIIIAFDVLSSLRAPHGPVRGEVGTVQRYHASPSQGSPINELAQQDSPDERQWRASDARRFIFMSP